MTTPHRQEVDALAAGFDPDPARSLSLNADAHTARRWFDFERDAIFARNWIRVRHEEKLRAPGAYLATEVAGRPVALVRDRDGALRAFYDVCRRRAHRLLEGEGGTTRILRPYHAWVYDLTGRLRRAPETEALADFDPGAIRLDEVRVEAFRGFIYVNLDAEAAPLGAPTGDLAAEVTHWAPDVGALTFGRRLTCDIRADWKNAVDNVLECYHRPTAHKDFCALVDMDA